MHLWLMRHLRTCTDKWRPTATVPHNRKALKLHRRYAQNKAPPPENSLATGGCFECNTDRVTALGWLKKAEDEQI